MLADERLSMAERVERVMRGKPKMSGAALRIVDKMQGFTRQLEIDERTVERWQEERDAALRKQTNG